MKNRRPCILSSALLCALSGISAHAQSYTWSQTAAGTGYDWYNGANWTPDTSIPDAPGAIANLNNDISGAQTIRLRKDIITGTLNLGDAAATTNSFGFTIGNAAGEAYTLTLDSGAANTAAQINLSSSGTPTNTLGVPVLLNSNLSINLGSGSQVLTLSAAGSLSTGSGATARNITVTNGTGGANQFTLTGDLTGSGVFTNNSNAAVIITNAKSFTGTFVLNKGIGGSNTGSLAVTTGSIANASEVIINGFLTGGATQNGGILHSGNSSPASVNPGQRLTQNRITMNGGSLTAGGQAMSGDALSSLVEDTVSTFDFNSGYSLVTISANNNSGGTRLNINTLERSPGASAFVRSGTLGGTARLLINNGSTFLKGAGEAEGTTTMSIIPWMTAAGTNGNAASADTFATYTTTGIRGLSITAGVEYASSITAGAESNVSTATVAVPAAETNVTINSLRYTTSSVTNIGADKMLSIRSGGLIFTIGGSIGGSGNPAAGTLQFGLENAPAEAVIWSNGNNTNTIGASISGSAGLSKAGTGTLILTGDNTYTGLTYVGGGTLQLGDGTNDSNLGITGDVTVANGAVLSLLNDEAIADTATLRLEQFGLANGRLGLGTGVNETIGGLFLGDSFAAAGTYGSSASGATFQNDTFFSGPGVVTVVPEPTSAVLMLGGLGVLVLPRRRRA